MLRVDVHILQPDRLDETNGVGIRVRSMQNGQVLFTTSSMNQGVSLEGLTAATLDIGLQLNMAPGVYTIETLVFDRRHARLIASGPWVHVTVQAGKSFTGEIQMNPEMVLRPPARSDLRTPMGTQDFDSGEVRTAQRGA